MEAGKGCWRKVLVMQADLTTLCIVGFAFLVIGLSAGFAFGRLLAHSNLPGVNSPNPQRLDDARTDSLTGLPNRRAFDEHLLRQFDQWQERRAIWSVLMIDIDHFKSLNDSFGHVAGDRALVHVATVLRATLRHSDVVVRYGGDEFAVILPATEVHRAGQVADRARVAVQNAELVCEGQQLPITVSCGAANVENSDDSVAVLRRADQALYKAKHTGRNRSYTQIGAQSIAVDPAEDVV